MSHKQAKKARKGKPHLHPNWKRERRRMFNEALAQSVKATEKPAEPREPQATTQGGRADARLAMAGLMALAATASMR